LGHAVEELLQEERGVLLALAARVRLHEPDRLAWPPAEQP
jgi:hypothetical protein